MLSFTVTTPGDKPVGIGLQRFAESVRDWTPFWTDYFVPAWYSMMTQQYESEGGSTGARWAALSDAYAAWKEKHYPGQAIGVLSGAARASLTGENAAGAILNISKDKFAVGSSLGYPIFLQLGTGRRGAASGRRKYGAYRHGAGGGMPARPPMRVTSDFMVTVGRLMQRFAVDRAKAQGLLPASRLT